jgi:hypothetical protein
MKSEPQSKTLKTIYADLGQDSRKKLAALIISLFVSQEPETPVQPPEHGRNFPVIENR